MDDKVRDSRPVRGFLVRHPQGDMAIYKNKELSETDTKKYIKQPDGISYDVYSLEMIIAIAFKICSKETLLFRRFIINEICATKRGNSIILFFSCGKGGNLWYN